jgi:hypothetical protein
VVFSDEKQQEGGVEEQTLHIVSVVELDLLMLKKIHGK